MNVCLQSLGHHSSYTGSHCIKPLKCNKNKMDKNVSNWLNFKHKIYSCFGHDERKLLILSIIFRKMICIYRDTNACHDLQKKSWIICPLIIFVGNNEEYFNEVGYLHMYLGVCYSWKNSKTKLEQ